MGKVGSTAGGAWGRYAGACCLALLAACISSAGAYGGYDQVRPARPALLPRATATREPARSLRAPCPLQGMHAPDLRGPPRGGRGGGGWGDRGGGYGGRGGGRGGARGFYGGGARGASAEPPQPGRILRTWDVTNIVQSRDEQNLRELEILLMQV